MRSAVIDKTLLTGFLLLPFIALTGGIIHVAQRTTFYVLVFLVSAFILKNRWLMGMIIYWFIWTMYLIICYFIKATNNITVNTALLFNIYMLFSVLIIFVVSESKADNRLIYNIICISSIMQAGVAISQMWNADVFYWIYSQFIPLRRGIGITEPCGTLGNPNFLATYLTISLPFFFRRYWAWFCPVIFAIVMSASQSTATIAVVAGSIYFLWDRINKKVLTAGVVPFIVYLCIFKKSLTVNFTFDHPRLIWWAEALKQTSSNSLGFLFGMGPGAPWGGRFPIHNEWITLFHHFGWVGLMIAAGYIITLPRCNRILYTAFIIMFINAMGYYPFHLPTTGMLCLIVMGLLEKEGLRIRD